ncbi:MAG TPA: peptidylprolyl isomerase [Bacteroidales bacterium]|nr:peptidylprolyl isomerase [Bacteroidales bacterium]
MKTRSFFRLKHAILIGLLALTLGGARVSAQSDPVLLEVDGEKIALSEFLRIYNKNNLRNEPTDRKALEEYLELYINFRLKVREAMELKMDTVSAFRNELNGYRDQLAEPYLTDKEVDERLVQEAWDRLQYDIRASHILIKVNADAAPEDTLRAWRRILGLREQIIKGKDFGDLAEEVSEDPSARDREASRMSPAIKGNRGDLGYFTAFDMVYPFESMAFSTPEGSVSRPVRTTYGYHLIKVTARRPAMGRVHVAHIFVRYPESGEDVEVAAAQAKINEAWMKIQQGTPFDSLVEVYSEDKGSAKKGGMLSWFGSNRMVPAFIEAIAGLREAGNVSAPVRTDYGWHIIKLLERQPVGPFAKEEPGLRKRIAKDSRSNLSRESFIETVKQQYGFRENLAARDAFYAVVTDSVFFARWKPEAAAHMQLPLFSIGDAQYTQADLAAFIHQRQRNRTPLPIREFVDEEYREMVAERCIDYKDARLEKEYPEFKALMQEYHDGILLFELTDQKVWGKAVKDTLGLEAYFNAHRQDYLWGERLDASVLRCTGAKAGAQARKLAEKAVKKGQGPESITGRLNKKGVEVVKADRRKYSRGDDARIDALPWTPGLGPSAVNGEEHSFVMVHALLQPMPKELPECRGLVTADYQTYLEKEWIRELRQRYPVKVNASALDQAGR